MKRVWVLHRRCISLVNHLPLLKLYQLLNLVELTAPSMSNVSREILVKNVVGIWLAKTFAFGQVHIGTVTSQPTEPVILPLAVAYDLFFLYDVLPRMKYLCMQFYINSCRKFGHFPTSRCRKSIDRSS